MGNSYLWNAGNAAFATPASWIDLATGAGAVAAPGSLDTASIDGPSSGVLVITGPGSAAALNVTGGVAVGGTLGLGTLVIGSAVASGTLALLAGASLSAATAATVSGALDVAGGQVAIAGTLDLAGEAAVSDGGTLGIGALSLAGGTVTLDADSGFVVGSATASAGALVVAAGASFVGWGSVDSDLVTAGTVLASGGALSLLGPVDGTGVLVIDPGATLFAPEIDAGVSVAFAAAAGTLDLFDGAFAGCITSIAPGDVIDLTAEQATAASWSDGTLTLCNDGVAVDTLSMTGIAAGTGFFALPDGGGGTCLLLASGTALLSADSSNNVSIACAADQVLVLGGGGNFATLALTGSAALAVATTVGTLSLGTSASAGILIVMTGVDLDASVANLANGLLQVTGTGASLAVAGTLTLAGAADVVDGGVVQAAALVLTAGTLSIDAAGAVVVGGGAASLGTLTVAAAATLSGSGRITGEVEDAGTILASGGVLMLAGDVAGDGLLEVAAGATLFIAGSVAAATGLSLAAGGVLEMLGGDCAGSITGLADGGTIDFASMNLSGVTWTANGDGGGTLALQAGAATVATLALSGDYTSASFVLAVDGFGGTCISVGVAAGGGTVDPPGTLDDGTLYLGAGELYAVSSSLTVDGLVLQGGTLALDAAASAGVGCDASTADTLTVAAQASIVGTGCIHATVADAGEIVASGGMLALFGSVDGSGTLAIASGATLFVPDGVGAGVTVAFAAGTGTLDLFVDATSFAGTITGLGAGDVIDVTCASITAATYAATGASSGTLTLVGADGDAGTIALEGAYAGHSFLATSDGAGGDLVSLVPCFMAGTRIATPAGEVTVDALRPGDRVLTLSGPRPVRWIGRRGYAAPVVAGNRQLRPVHIRANALADGVPHRDLLVSPQHALFLDGWLVPAVALLNGASITRAADGPVRYFHLELDRHDVLLAEGAPAESFFDGGHRDLFHGGIGRPCPARRPCAPRLEGGFRLAALRRRLAARAGLPLPSRRPPGALRGHVERIVPASPGLRVEGWALDAAGSDQPLELEALCDGFPPLEVLADIWRPDLDRAGLAGGCCAFAFALPPARRVVVRRRVDGAVLPGPQTA